MYTRSAASDGARLTSQQVLIRQQRSGYRSVYRKPAAPKKKHWGRYFVVLAAFVILLPLFSLTKHSDAAIAELKSGISGYCMDDYQNSAIPNTIVDNWDCNGSAAQEWAPSQGTITHDATYCLGVANNSKANGAKLVSSTCSEAPGQVWFAEKGGYMNPNSGLCLSAPSSQSTPQLILASCNNLGHPSESWSSAASKPGASVPTDTCNDQVGGQKVACIAEQQWSDWQANPSNHAGLLNNYSIGNGYEEWCADFVSYDYMTAGQPFTNGERNGWDEYNANNIQYQGFTKHWVGSYTPKTGDIAFFDYPGGHVELVASGGKNPTFIYGDSATVDPVTGNGDMATNTLTSDGTLGEVTYYLSPNN
jgi:hypothetical protein